MINPCHSDSPCLATFKHQQLAPRDSEAKSLGYESNLISSRCRLNFCLQYRVTAKSHEESLQLGQRLKPRSAANLSRSDGTSLEAFL